MNTDEQMRQLYADCYLDPSYKMGIARKVNMLQAIARCAEACTALGRTSLSLLDAGCGRGELLEHCAKNSFGGAVFTLLRGLEIVPELTGNFSGYSVDLVPSLARAEVAGKYDIVTCSDVLEHVPEEDAEASVAKLFELSSGFVIMHVAWFPHLWSVFPGGKTVDLHCTKHPLSWWIEVINKVSGTALVMRSTDHGNKTGIIVAKVY